MAKWEPIRRTGKPYPQSVHPEDPSRLVVRVPLSTRPPKEWSSHFVRSYTENHRMPWFREGLVPAPRIEEDAVVIAPLDNELEAWVVGIDQKIQQANEFYEQYVVKPMEARQEAARAAEEDERRRLEEARRIADRLEP